MCGRVRSPSTGSGRRAARPTCSSCPSALVSRERSSSDGHLLVAGGYAGELGHLIVEPNGDACGCGRRGCLETVASGAAIGRRYATRAGRPSATAAEVADLVADRGRHRMSRVGRGGGRARRCHRARHDGGCSAARRHRRRPVTGWGPVARSAPRGTPGSPVHAAAAAHHPCRPRRPRRLPGSGHPCLTSRSTLPEDL